MPAVPALAASPELTSARKPSLCLQLLSTRFRCHCPLCHQTTQVPTPAQVRGVSAELARRATLPPHVKAVLEALPQDTHPMTQFIAMITALQVRVPVLAAGCLWG